MNRVLQSRASMLATNSTRLQSVWEENACTLTADFPLVMSRSATEQVLRSYAIEALETVVYEGKCSGEESSG